MAQHYTPIWDDWAEVTQELNDQEKGRLIDAIVAYDIGGDWQERIKGNERYVFPGYKARIDRWKETCENRKNAKESDEDKTQQKNQNVTKKSDSDKTHKDKDKDKDKVLKETPLKGSKEKPERATGESDRAFDKFWAIYPRHEGKQDARKAFDKLKPDPALLETIVNAITVQKQSAQWQDSRYIPHPATWLNGRRWEDEPVKDTDAVGKPRLLRSQDYHQREYDGKKLEDELGVNDLFKEGEAV